MALHSPQESKRKTHTCDIQWSCEPQDGTCEVAELLTRACVPVSLSCPAYWLEYNGSLKCAYKRRNSNKLQRPNAWLKWTAATAATTRQQKRMQLQQQQRVQQQHPRRQRHWSTGAATWMRRIFQRGQWRRRGGLPSECVLHDAYTTGQERPVSSPTVLTR